MGPFATTRGSNNNNSHINFLLHAYSNRASDSTDRAESLHNMQININMNVKMKTSMNMNMNMNEVSNQWYFKVVYEGQVHMSFFDQHIIPIATSTILRSAVHPGLPFI